MQAEAKYRDFLNRFPTSEQAPYVQFQIANSLAKRMEKPDRDQTVTRKALEAYQELIRLYPTSEYAAQAQEQINLVRNNLAEHEFTIGRFYLRYGIPVAAVQRFEFLLENYPQYPEQDKVIYHLGARLPAEGKTDEAKKAFDRLRTEHPAEPLPRGDPAYEESSHEASASAWIALGLLTDLLTAGCASTPLRPDPRDPAAGDPDAAGAGRRAAAHRRR